jgi:hypothetical protein
MKQAGCSSTDQGGGKRRDALKPDYLLTGGFGGAVGPVLFFSAPVVVVLFQARGRLDMFFHFYPFSFRNSLDRNCLIVASFSASPVPLTFENENFSRQEVCLICH